jgi:hypothetical protein
MKDIARKFAGQPLVILSVSLDSGEQRWKDFIAQNGMTWPQYRDAGFNGAVAKLFSVSEIPHTFTHRFGRHRSGGTHRRRLDRRQAEKARGSRPRVAAGKNQ